MYSRPPYKYMLNLYSTCVQIILPCSLLVKASIITLNFSPCSPCFRTSWERDHTQCICNMCKHIQTHTLRCTHVYTRIHKYVHALYTNNTSGTHTTPSSSSFHTQLHPARHARTFHHALQHLLQLCYILDISKPLPEGFSWRDTSVHATDRLLALRPSASKSICKYFQWRIVYNWRK